MMRRIAVPVLAAAVLSIVGPAAAQDKSAARKACAGDYQKYCAGVAIGGGRIKKCLTEHLNELTPDCRSAVIAFTTKDTSKP